MTLFSFIFEHISQQQFLDEYCDRAPLHIKGAKHKFADLFDIQAFNQILNGNTLLYPKVRITNHNNTIHKYDLIDDVDRYANNQNNTLNKKKMLHAIARGGTLVFDNGRIVEDGDHHSLLARGGLYARLWAHQSGGFLGEEAEGADEDTDGLVLTVPT